jgi:hypothetical protein
MAMGAYQEILFSWGPRISVFKLSCLMTILSLSLLLGNSVLVFHHSVRI